VLADSSVAVLALPAIYRELEVDLGDLHWVLTTSNVLALVRLRPRGSRAQHWRNHWRATRRLALKVRRLQQFSQRCTPLPKPRAHVRFMPGALPKFTKSPLLLSNFLSYAGIRRETLIYDRLRGSQGQRGATQRTPSRRSGPAPKLPIHVCDDFAFRSRKRWRSSECRRTVT
jgi:hypothetical protein